MRSSSPSSGIAVLRVDGLPDGAPTMLDAACARLALRWSSPAPLCCAVGAPIDVRAKLELERASRAHRPHLKADAWAPEGPVLDGGAPSGVIERLITTEHGCAALDDPRFGVRGEGCGIRAAARAAGKAEDVWLLSGCALFPLEVVEDTFVPSPRIPDSALAEARPDEPSLWDEARARVAIRYGDEVASRLDAATRELRSHKPMSLHLRTLK